MFSLLDENCNYRHGHKDTRENTQKLPESHDKCVGLFSSSVVPLGASGQCVDLGPTLFITRLQVTPSGANNHSLRVRFSEKIHRSITYTNGKAFEEVEGICRIQDPFDTLIMLLCHEAEKKIDYKAIRVLFGICNKLRKKQSRCTFLEAIKRCYTL